jgi:hypothetical protein
MALMEGAVNTFLAPWLVSGLVILVAPISNVEQPESSMTKH